jgi:hypothetical protein
MTNGEINLQIAKKALEAGKLNDFESKFVESVKDCDKYDLKKLSKKQYDI